MGWHNADGFTRAPGEGYLPKDEIAINEALVIRMLRSGKSPKTIAFITGYTPWAIWKFIERHLSVRSVFVETYKLRYPNKEEPPDKIKIAVQ
jgi:hypothetical protein